MTVTETDMFSRGIITFNSSVRTNAVFSQNCFSKIFDVIVRPGDQSQSEYRIDSKDISFIIQNDTKTVKFNVSFPEPYNYGLSYRSQDTLIFKLKEQDYKTVDLRQIILYNTDKQTLLPAVGSADNSEIGRSVIKLQMDSKLLYLF